jgi:Flp pilus assembly protein TadG
MMLRAFAGDARGASAVEFAITAPIFCMLLVGIVEGGMLLWAQIGLQHGTQMAARCATIDTSVCGSADQIQSYAAQQSYGLNPPSSTFSFSAAACGNQVSASYRFALISNYFGMPALQIRAQSCFPT